MGTRCFNETISFLIEVVEVAFTVDFTNQRWNIVKMLCFILAPLRISDRTCLTNRNKSNF